MEKTKDAATTQCAEVETKVEKALETFVALEKAEKVLLADLISGFCALQFRFLLPPCVFLLLEIIQCFPYEVCKQQNQQYRDLKKSLEDLHGNQKDVQEKARQRGMLQCAADRARLSGHKFTRQ